MKLYKNQSQRMTDRYLEKVQGVNKKEKIEKR